jgi:hypothetical protein
MTGHRVSDVGIFAVKAFPGSKLKEILFPVALSTLIK